LAVLSLCGLPFLDILTSHSLDDAHSCQYCENIFVDLLEVCDGFNSKYTFGFSLDIGAVKVAVQAKCTFLSRAIDIDPELLAFDTRGCL
jgi:hypothetical protein